jgi:hypothetical protein
MVENVKSIMAILHKLKEKQIFDYIKLSSRYRLKSHVKDFTLKFHQCFMCNHIDALILIFICANMIFFNPFSLYYF